MAQLMSSKTESEASAHFIDEFGVTLEKAEGNYSVTYDACWALESALYHMLDNCKESERE